MKYKLANHGDFRIERSADSGHSILLSMAIVETNNKIEEILLKIVFHTYTWDPFLYDFLDHRKIWRKEKHFIKKTITPYIKFLKHCTQNDVGRVIPFSNNPGAIVILTHLL